MHYYIYVDDIREDAHWYNTHLTREEYEPHICYNYQMTLDLINSILRRDAEAAFIFDLDHDLGEGNENELEPNGYDICRWLVENRINIIGFHIHSMNPVGAENMRQLLSHYGYKELY